MKIFKIIFWGTIIVLFTGGFLWNCTFLMDTTKYPDRLTCGVNQYVNAIQYVFGKIFNHRMGKIENKIETLQDAMSGTLNISQSGTTNK